MKMKSELHANPRLAHAKKMKPVKMMRLTKLLQR
jgi:hypothetical protein